MKKLAIFSSFLCVVVCSRSATAQSTYFRGGQLPVQNQDLPSTVVNSVGQPSGYVPVTNGAGHTWTAQSAFMGAPGTNGTNGNTVLPTTGAPATSTGNNGDFAIDAVNGLIYGPKSSGAWGAGKSIVGPQGAPGAMPAGANISVAPTQVNGTAGSLYWSQYFNPATGFKAVHIQFVGFTSVSGVTITFPQAFTIATPNAVTSTPVFGVTVGTLSKTAATFTASVATTGDIEIRGY